jgi:nucleoside-diphosphate-sugar epimerase
VKVLVTGGGGFLGSHLVERLQADGVVPFVARRSDYDLTLPDDAERLFADASPDLVFHLAAEVGGIGANMANPGRYWYANLMMVLEQSRIAVETGFGGQIVWDISKPNGQPRRKLDTSRAEREFGFRAKTPFRKGIKETVAWYRASVPELATG